MLKTSLEPSARRKLPAALDRYYDAVQRQRGTERLLAEANILEDWLVGFLTQLRSKATVGNGDKSSGRPAR